MSEFKELDEAILLAYERKIASNSNDEPDAVEIHHAYYLIRKGKGQAAPSFDTVRYLLKKTAA